MAFSFSMNKDETNSGTQTGQGPVPPRVLTMEDDLEDIASGKSSHTEKNAPLTQQDVRKTTHSPSSQTPNPFQSTEEKLSVPIPPQANKSGMPANTLNVPKPFPQTSEPTLQKKEANLFVIVGALIIIIALILGGVFYYSFFVSKNKGGVSQEMTPQRTEVQTIAEQEPEKEIIPLKEPLYAIDKPNYLSINVEVMSEKDIYEVLSVTANRIKESNFIDPVEFIITDQNNTPLAFSRFSLLMKMNIGSKLLATLDEPFILSLYNDAGDIRIGMKLSIADQSGFVSEIVKSEKTLPIDLQSLFLMEAKNIPKVSVFKSNTFVGEDTVTKVKKEYAIRYTNVNAEEKLSIDYAVVGNEWYIGTSQNTLIALLKEIGK